MSKEALVTAEDYRLGDTILQGSFDKQVFQVRLLVNNVLKAQALKNESTGEYRIYLADKYITSKEDKVIILAVDALHNEVDSISVPVLE